MVSFTFISSPVRLPLTTPSSFSHSNICSHRRRPSVARKRALILSVDASSSKQTSDETFESTEDTVSTEEHTSNESSESSGSAESENGSHSSPHDTKASAQSDDSETDTSDGDGVPPPDDNGDGGGNGRGEDEGGDSRGRGSFAATLGRNVQSTASQIKKGKFGDLKSGVSDTASRAYSRFLALMKYTLKIVPPPVVVALISLVSTVSGAKFKENRDKEVAKIKEDAENKKRKEEIERELRKIYGDLAAPILKSAAKLAERLYVLIHDDWNTVELDVHDEVSATYSAYLLGRYLATVEIIKRESALLDYGFPAADRILANILGRVQGVLGANDDILMEMQRREDLFRPADGLKVLKGGPLRITARAQTVLAELLLRKMWVNRYDFVDEVEEDDLKRGPRAVISFFEFSQLLQKESSVTKWYEPIMADFQALERRARRHSTEKRRRDDIGSRIYFLQNGLLDLVEFFDPMPDPHAVPLYRRQRLQLGEIKYVEEQRSPLSLRLLYRELAKMRDHRITTGTKIERLSLPRNAVEVHVKGAPPASDVAVKPTRPGDCPFSQRVMIVLEEAKIPYQAVYHMPHSKAAWYYLFHPENKTPVVYHEGKLIEDSSHIVSYLLDKFPKSSKLGSTQALHLVAGTPAYTKFHDVFLKWVEDGVNRAVFEREIRELNRLIKYAQTQNVGGKFLGGTRFSREDTAIAPMLNNVEVAGKAVMNWTLPEDCEALRTYLNAARQMESFQKTVPTEEAIVDGYLEHRRGRGAVKRMCLTDMLE